ncbi:hypothetical protein [Burkholderia cepacia]|uniref:hypothetical protein n=1 Tax=Burkholderia cepacia TaxID=292 RepID=UPI000A831FB2|nr:hypothetical protein [Burkholderia cepacia]
MAKFILDGQALDNLAGKLQELGVLFDVIQEEVTGGKVRACVLCDIGRELAERTGTDISELRRVSRAEVSNG